MPALDSPPPHLLRSLLDAIPSFVFVVDQDIAIVEHNVAAGRLLAEGGSEVLRRRTGDVMHCVHATHAPAGCGTSEQCRDCVIRNTVGEAFREGRCVRRRAKLELLQGGHVSDLHVLITASSFAHLERPLVLLVIEDISEIVELQRIIPICMNCKKVRDDNEYWTQVEAYFSRRLDMNFSHGYCPDCAQAELDRLKSDARIGL